MEINLDEVKQMYSQGIRSKIYGTADTQIRTKLRQHLLTLNPKSAFEFGCSAGMNLKILRDTINTVVSGIDINKTAIEYGQEKFGLENVIYGDENVLNTYETESFDIVFTCSVLCHIPNKNIEPIIQNLLRMAKKYVVFMETNDELDVDLFAHNYKKYGLVSKWSFESKKPIGNGCVYECWELIK